MVFVCSSLKSLLSRSPRSETPLLSNWDGCFGFGSDSSPFSFSGFGFSPFPFSGFGFSPFSFSVSDDFLYMIKKDKNGNKI